MLVSELEYENGSGLADRGGAIEKDSPKVSLFEISSVGMDAEVNSDITVSTISVQHDAEPRRRRAPRITALDQPMPPPAIFPLINITAHKIKKTCFSPISLDPVECSLAEGGGG
jgi:hypothetical protein